MQQPSASQFSYNLAAQGHTPRDSRQFKTLRTAPRRVESRTCVGGTRPLRWNAPAGRQTAVSIARTDGNTRERTSGAGTRAPLPTAYIHLAATAGLHQDTAEIGTLPLIALAGSTLETIAMCVH